MTDRLTQLIAALSSNPNHFTTVNDFSHVQSQVRNITRIAIEQLRVIDMYEAGLDIADELTQERQDVFDCWCSDHKANGGRMTFRQFETGYYLRGELMQRSELSDSQTARFDQLERSLFPGEHQ